MYSDNTILTFGKHKFVRLSRVPPDYLIGMYNKKKYVNEEIKEYIENNIEKIKERKNGATLIQKLDEPCAKILYLTENEAKVEIKKINMIEQKHKKPTRAYECEKCGGWHLTSLSREDWQTVEKKE